MMVLKVTPTLSVCRADTDDGNESDTNPFCLQGTVQGTVPYLGTFLTDLTMLDTAMPDMTEDGLINFDKRRKEFEVLAQIRLLQSAAQIYNLQFDPRYWVWFDSLRVFTDTERWGYWGNRGSGRDDMMTVVH